MAGFRREGTRYAIGATEIDKRRALAIKSITERHNVSWGNLQAMIASQPIQRSIEERDYIRSYMDEYRRG